MNSGDNKLNSGITIIIPCFNSSSTISKVLRSIASQNLSSNSFDKVEVIILDDASDEKVEDKLESIKYKFDLKIIRFTKNLGRSKARNIGIQASKFEYLIFLDSDTLLDPNYLFEMHLRLSIIPDAVFVSFKECIENNDKKISNKSIRNGLPKPSNFSGDWRISAKVDAGKPGLVEIKNNQEINILGDTDYFKSFGHGRFIGVFDLAATVATHNIAICKSTLLKTRLFSSDFSGWGLEDTLLGCELIANGNFVIPVLSTGVYHINHPPRSGSDETKRLEFLKNLEIYKEKLYERNKFTRE